MSGSALGGSGRALGGPGRALGGSKYRKTPDQGVLFKLTYSIGIHVKTVELDTIVVSNRRPTSEISPGPRRAGSK